MDNKKRMMFILEEDYYFITIKLLVILNKLGCKMKAFVDYRKLGIIFEFIRNDRNMVLFNKMINNVELDILENDHLLKIYCDSNMDISIIKRVLFFLEEQNIVELQKNNRFSCIDVKLLNRADISDLLEQDILIDDVKRVEIIQNSISRIRSLKFQTLQTKIFGYSEVTKWVD